MELERVRDLTLPGIGLGTMRMQGEDCQQIVGAALAEGYRHLDTARKYGNEADVGRALAASSVPRDEVVLVTKLAPDALGADDVGPTTEESLRLLETDYVDMLLIHWPSPDVPLEDTLGAMVEVRERGLTLAIGVANFPNWMLEQAWAVTDELVTDQVEYHPYLSQQVVLEPVRGAGMVLTAYCPLGRGTVLDDPTLASIAGDHGCTPAQIALRWLVQQERVIAIPGTSSLARLGENLATLDGPQLGDDEMARISALAHDQGRVVDPPHAPTWDPAPA